MHKVCDVLIIGSGISGLSYAIHLLKNNPHTKITIITKADSDETATKYAQGGIAVVLDGDKKAHKKHIQDTIIAGDGLCDKKIVEIVITEGEKCVNELVNWGVSFDKKRNGDFDLHLEGGHSKHRILHHKDITGKIIEESLLNHLRQSYPNVQIIDHRFAIDFCIDKKNSTPKILGCEILNIHTNEISTLLSKVVLIASGGIGQIYKYTTNPSIATGDGIAMASRMDVALQNMAFVQFHPTAYYNPKSGKQFLLTEALRGAGAVLTDKENNKFMQKYDERKELAPRDIVSRAILTELKQGKTVYLDMTSIPCEELTSNFPNIYEYFFNLNIDLCKEPVEVQPAAHYLCGGIVTNEWAQVSKHNNLFAVGECAYTGLHGANRLASNSLLEATVFASRAAQKTIEILNDSETKNPSLYIEKEDKKSTVGVKQPLTQSQHQQIIKHIYKVKNLMNEHANIIRNTVDIKKTYQIVVEINNIANEILKQYRPSLLVYRLRNISRISMLVLQDSLEQTVNRGTYYNSSLL